MNGYALDTNIISFAIRGNVTLQQKIYNEANSGTSIVIPSIAYYELKRGLLDAKATTKLKLFEHLCNSLSVDVIDMATLERAAGIYVNLKQSGRIIDDADILIAASCIAHDYVLVTDNTKHFDRVDGLNIVNWI